ADRPRRRPAPPRDRRHRTRQTRGVPPAPRAVARRLGDSTLRDPWPRRGAAGDVLDVRERGFAEELVSLDSRELIDRSAAPFLQTEPGPQLTQHFRRSLIK